jgi:hypothetical protein
MDKLINKTTLVATILTVMDKFILLCFELLSGLIINFLENQVFVTREDVEEHTGVVNLLN